MSVHVQKLILVRVDSWYTPFIVDFNCGMESDALQMVGIDVVLCTVKFGVCSLLARLYML